MATVQNHDSLNNINFPDALGQSYFLLTSYCARGLPSGLERLETTPLLNPQSSIFKKPKIPHPIAAGAVWRHTGARFLLSAGAFTFQMSSCSLRASAAIMRNIHPTLALLLLRCSSRTDKEIRPPGIEPGTI